MRTRDEEEKKGLKGQMELEGIRKGGVGAMASKFLVQEVCSPHPPQSPPAAWAARARSPRRAPCLWSQAMRMIDGMIDGCKRFAVGI